MDKPDSEYAGGLIFRRKTTPLPGTQPGFVYLRSSNNGNEELVFDSHKHAEEWAARNNVEYRMVLVLRP